MSLLKVSGSLLWIEDFNPVDIQSWQRHFLGDSCVGSLASDVERTPVVESNQGKIGILCEVLTEIRFSSLKLGFAERGVFQQYRLDFVAVQKCSPAWFPIANVLVHPLDKFPRIRLQSRVEKTPFLRVKNTEKGSGPAV